MQNETRVFRNRYIRAHAVNYCTRNDASRRDEFLKIRRVVVENCSWHLIHLFLQMNFLHSVHSELCYDLSRLLKFIRTTIISSMWRIPLVPGVMPGFTLPSRCLSFCTAFYWGKFVTAGITFTFNALNAKNVFLRNIRLYRKHHGVFVLDEFSSNLAIFGVDLHTLTRSSSSSTFMKFLLVGGNFKWLSDKKRLCSWFT